MTGVTTHAETRTGRLIQRLIDGDRCRWVTADTIDNYLAGPGLALLLFTGDPMQRPEAGDVAVIVRELLRLGGPRIRAAVVERSDEDRLKTRFGAVVVPNLVFVRDGRTLGLIPRVQDWNVYLRHTTSSLDAVAGGAASPGAPVQ